MWKTYCRVHDEYDKGVKMRWIGMPRITAGIGLLNLVYNLARYEQILRLRLA